MAAKRLRDGSCFDENAMQPAAKRLRARAAATAEARTTTTLPVDLLLEIVARLDAATTVRCAAAGKSIRRAILDPSFRRIRLALRAAANGAGFDPTLLFAVSYKLARLDDPPVLIVEDPQSAAGGAAAPFAISGKFLGHIVEPPPPSSYRPVLPIYKSYDSELKHSETVASRDVLVVLRERPVGVRAFCTVPRQQLCICNSLTGDTTRLPIYELLVMDKRLQTQTFSSEDGKWGAIRAMEELPHPISSPLYAHRPLVVSRRNAVYWLCPQRLGGVTADLHILAVDVGADRRRASRIELPPDCLSRMKPFGWQSDGIILAPSPSPDGELSLIVAEVLVISQWTLLPSSSSSSSEGGSPAARWSRQVVISRLAIDRQAGHDMFMGVVCFHGLGLVSGAVLMQVRVLDTVLIALLHLASKECLILRRWDKMSRPSELCLHEIDLASVLQSM
ncbi:hypothetical protein OsJ_12778 [Oryza sativa Japonica Group]|uniref:DUF7595 domain-containing protein n=1 Tax=Oryza sativa subsp. japonica TaxID=39947 RepID=B9F5Z0_ORYSJ|nr:hypothetical protein OsJ_12778 [Oryza sativa Japonica Group]